ncbi:MAG: NAD+ synthase [Candidatus Marinimicrobia bacterium]|nr:NAD+ synthase [Candidatus Neomarinimicrobiota bacterium]
MKIALIQMNPTVGALKENTEKILSFIQEAQKNGADLVVFPELSITGYPPQDLIFEPNFVTKNRTFCEKIARETQTLDIVSLVGFIDNPTKDTYYNAIAVICQGKIVDTIYKTLLPTYDVFDEKRYFQSNPSIHPVICNIKGKSVSLGIEICEDLWDEAYSIKVTQELVRQGADIIINCSASPYSYKKVETRKKQILKKIQTYHIPFCYVNCCGGQDELIFDGNSFMVDSHGQWLAHNGSFDETLSYVELDDTFSAQDTLGEPMFHPDEELFKALKTGVRDYFRKTGFTDALLGLSGGIDSSLVAVIASEALGSDHVWGIIMPSQFSSDHSVKDAIALAKNLGIHYDMYSIQKIYEIVLETLKKPFEGTPFGLAEENIQARSRGILLMALANKFHRLVLTTGNKTELALGYSTLYGDMAGSLAVISDLNKEDVYRLSYFVNQQAGYDRIPENILTKIPSAELREGQTDPFDYAIVSPLVEALLNQEKSLEDLVEEGYDRELVCHIKKLIFQAEYKRRQTPPGLRVTEKAFGMGRKMPIVNKYMDDD